MQYQDLLTKAADLQENHRARWTKCVRNHRSFFVTKDVSGKQIFVPMNYVAFVNGGGSPDTSKIVAKPQNITAICDVLESNGYYKVTTNNSGFENVFQDYLLYYTNLPGPYRKDYEEKRRSAGGSLDFWTQIPNVDEVLSV